MSRRWRRRIALPTRYARLGLVLSLLLVPLATCAEERVRSEAQPPPSWVTKVYPSPGADSTGVRVVEVRYRLSDDALEAVHLQIDGTDVSEFAKLAPGVLQYDPTNLQNPPLRLTPGQHRATVRRVRLPEMGAEQHQVLDSYTWSFSIQ